MVSESRTKTIGLNALLDTAPAKSGTHSEIIFAKGVSENKQKQSKQN